MIVNAPKQGQPIYKGRAQLEIPDNVFSLHVQYILNSKEDTFSHIDQNYEAVLKYMSFNIQQSQFLVPCEEEDEYP
jgi:hypothetical protein